MKRNLNIGLLILRLNIGILMLMHGISKLVNGVSGIVHMLEDKGYPGFLAYGVYVGEVLAPLLIIAGFRTRIAAILFALNCIIAMLLAHPNDILRITKHGAWGVELLGLYLFCALVLVFTGGGKYAYSTSNRWD